MKYYYSTEEPQGNIEFYESACMEYEVDWSAPLSDAVEEMAEDYYSNHDGWETKWPVAFYVWDRNKKFLGSFTVECEFNPLFRATEINNR